MPNVGAPSGATKHQARKPPENTRPESPQKTPGQKAPRKGRHDIPRQIYLITTVTQNRQPFFAHLPWARVVIRTLHLPETLHGSEWLAWVLIPDHFHGLLRLGEACSLATVVGKFKGRSVHELSECRGTRSKLWQKSFYDHALRKDEDIKAMARYMLANPLRAGLVDSIADYSHWDAVWL